MKRILMLSNLILLLGCSPLAQSPSRIQSQSNDSTILGTKDGKTSEPMCILYGTYYSLTRHATTNAPLLEEYLWDPSNHTWRLFNISYDTDGDGLFDHSFTVYDRLSGIEPIVPACQSGLRFEEKGPNQPPLVFEKQGHLVHSSPPPNEHALNKGIRNSPEYLRITGKSEHQN